jgi:O-methyltransferase
MSKFIKFFNSHNKLVKLKFKEDKYNRFYKLKYSNIYDSKENMLKSNMINIEQSVDIYFLLSQIILLKIPGDVVELGCYDGITSIIMQKTLDQFNSAKCIHVYDSFEGLPKQVKEDKGSIFIQGDMRVNKYKLIKNYIKYHTKLPEIHKGWFRDTLPQGLPNKICFAHLDGDFYTSILESLTYVYPKLAKGAIVVIDDYCDPKIHNVNNILPGVKKACDDFFRDKPEKMYVLIAGCESHGYFRKT